MTDAFTKLAPEIVQSSIWNEPSDIRIVWITLLAIKDAEGYVRGDSQVISRMANVPIEEVELALEKFQKPDPNSHTPDNDGRRIAPAPGGWVVLNHWLYRIEDRKQIHAEYMRKWREKASVNICDSQVKHPSASASASASVSVSVSSLKGGVGGEQAPPKDQPSPVGILLLAGQIRDCRPEFKGLNQMALENELKAVPIEDAKRAVDDFCKNMINAIKVPDMPLRLLTGYLRKAYDGARPRKKRSKIT